MFKQVCSLKIVIATIAAAILLSASVAYAKHPSWHEAAESFRRSGVVGEKLYTWINVTQGQSYNFSTKTMFEFINNEPEWPQMYKFREILEQDLASLSDYTDLEKWFETESPRTYEGAVSYTSYLLTIKKPDKAKKVLKDFWIKAKLDKKEVKSLYKKFSYMLKNEENSKRLRNLLWQGRLKDAETMLVYVDERTGLVGRTTIALFKGNPEANSLLNKLSKQEALDPLIIYGRLRWRRIKDNTDEAIMMLKLQPKEMEDEELWWTERNILARRKIENHKYKETYKIISQHGLTQGTEPYAQAEWLLGWLSLRFLNNPQKAYSHFENFQQSINSAISRSRASYWLGRADEALGNKDSAKNWYSLAAQFPSTFYGQLASEKVYGDYNPSMFLNDYISSSAYSQFKKNELVQALTILIRRNISSQITDCFFSKLFLNAKSRNDYLLIAKFAEEIGQTRYAVEANKRMQQNLGTFMFKIGYPKLEHSTHKESDKALIHSIIYRESMFDKNAVSSAGARGLMQLMPATAKAVSKTKGKFNHSNLTENPAYNVKLGTMYLEQLINSYNGFYPMAIAAYNAGPRNVGKWIKLFGDPRKKEVDVLDWVELIPIYETRNYVQRVMETYYIYQLKFSNKPKTVMDF